MFIIFIPIWHLSGTVIWTFLNLAFKTQLKLWNFFVISNNIFIKSKVWFLMKMIQSLYFLADIGLFGSNFQTMLLSHFSDHVDLTTSPANTPHFNVFYAYSRLVSMGQRSASNGQWPVGIGLIRVIAPQRSSELGKNTSK